MDKNVPPGAALLLDFIGGIEAPKGYDTIYGNNQSKLPKPLTTMTVDEVIAAGPGWTRAYKSSAAGRYQFMNRTLKDIKSELKLRGTQTFDANLQDRLGYHLLVRRGYATFMAGKLSAEGFGKLLAQEWASLPVLADTKGASRQIKRGQSYYAGDGLNKSLVKPERVEAIIAQVRTADAYVPIPTPAAPPTSAPPKRKTLADMLKGWLVKKATDQIATQLKDTPLMNSNIFHNLLNIVIAIVAILSLPEVVGILPPDIGLAVVGVVGVLKTIINIARDGFGGLFKEQPPVR